MFPKSLSGKISVPNFLLSLKVLILKTSGFSSGEYCDLSITEPFSKSIIIETILSLNTSSAFFH